MDIFDQIIWLFGSFFVNITVPSKNITPITVESSAAYNKEGKTICGVQDEVYRWKISWALKIARSSCVREEYLLKRCVILLQYVLSS